MRNKKLARAEVLLQATFDILKQQKESTSVLNCLELTANYDGAECDGHCLLQDIADALDIELD